jgi:pantothenate kinase type III
MMLDALHEKTAQLPKLEFKGGPAVPAGPGAGDSQDTALTAVPPFGKNTREAMLLGVTSSIRGLVQHTVERYADFFGAYPQVVATGGDAPALFGDELSQGTIESIVPDLQLIGILEVCRAVEEMDAAGSE